MSLFRLTYCLKSLKDITSEIGCCTVLMWHVVLSLEKSTKSGLVGPGFGLRDSDVPDALLTLESLVLTLDTVRQSLVLTLS